MWTNASLQRKALHLDAYSMRDDNECLSLDGPESMEEKHKEDSR